MDRCEAFGFGLADLCLSYIAPGFPEINYGCKVLYGDRSKTRRRFAYALEMTKRGGKKIMEKPEECSNCLSKNTMHCIGEDTGGYIYWCHHCGMYLDSMGEKNVPYETF